MMIYDDIAACGLKSHAATFTSERGPRDHGCVKKNRADETCETPSDDGRPPHKEHQGLVW